MSYRTSEQDKLDQQSMIAFAAKTAKEEGRMEGERNKELSVIQTLINDTDFNDQKIAALMGMEEKTVSRIRADMRCTSGRR